MTGWPRRIAWRLRALFGRGRLERELDDELRLHIELESEELAREEGLAPDEARRRALVAFGGVERFKEDHRDARGVRWLEELVLDARYAIRSLWRTPAFTVSAVLVLALGIGASTAIFSAVDAVLISRLPYPHDEQLVRIYQKNSTMNRWSLSTVDYRAIESRNRSLSSVGAIRLREVAVSVGGEARRMWIGSPTSGVLRALGIHMARGRGLVPSDERLGAPPVAVITAAYAARELGGESAALGRTLTIDGVAHTVVGVLPPGLDEIAGFRVPVWPVLQLEEPERRGPFGLAVIARLADGVTLEQAARDLSRISVEIFPEWEVSFQDRTSRFTPYLLRTTILRDAGRTLGIFGAAVALVLLIAVANVASLSLVRAAGRWREATLRTALGATRTRLVRLLVTESLVLSTAGALLGIVVGTLALRALTAIGPDIPRLYLARLDLRAALFAIGVSIVAGIIAAASPVLLLARRDLALSLREGDRMVGPGQRAHGVRGAFVVAEFALALPLLAGAGLLLNSFVRLQRVAPGFDPARLLTVRVPLTAATYGSDSAVSAYWARALPRVLEVPGVIGAGLNDAMPPDDDAMNVNNFDLADRPVAPGDGQPTSPWMVVSGDFFDAIGLQLLEGRRFTPTDTGVAPVVIVSRAWARHYYPDGRVIGRQLISGGCVTCPRTTVVGVVSDVKYQGLGATSDAVYSPLTEGWSRTLVLFVRTASPPREALPRVRAALRSVDPGIPLEDAAPMEERLDASVAAPRHLATLVGAFATAALVLAAIGIFGMLSFTVASRRREIGVRMALGAGRTSVVALIVARGMRHALLGATIGLVATIALTRRLADALFDVRATDPWTLASTTALLLSVALLASWLPARRAASIHPIDAIRDE